MAEEAAVQAPPEFLNRRKVPLGPGYSLMDWMNLCNSGKDLSGTGLCGSDVLG
jgi:hypothetical protein